MSERFLLVDDEPVMRSALRALLRRLHPDADFVEADNAHDAFVAFERDQYSAVFLDMNLANGPGGLYTTGLMARATSQSPIILATGLSPDDPKVKAALARGARALLAKPYRLDALRAVLATAAQLREAKA